MISLLLASKRDSKFLAKFVMTFMVNTKDFDNVELLIFTPKGSWNAELFEYFKDKIRVYDDNTGLGRGGSHVYYDELSKHAKGDWMWYLCDDHYLYPGYDDLIMRYIKLYSLDPNYPHVIAPMCDNSGRISHIFSKKYVELVGFGPQGNVDSCTNETIERFGGVAGKEEHDRLLVLLSEPVMHDFSMDKDLFKSEPFDEQKEIRLFKSKKIKNKLQANAVKLAKYG